MNTKIKIFLVKFIIIVILFLSIIITIKDNNSIKLWLKDNVLTNNISFTKIQNKYIKYFGNIIPFNKYVGITPVFSEKLKYTDLDEYKDGVKLKVTNNYLLPSLNSGIVIFVGEKEDYGNTIIIDGEETIWYSNVNSNVKLYDEVKKGEFLGEVNGENLYLLFKKEGNVIDYKKYL
ncbi:MAG: M23 family metallopeptidase [Bacilli bacterium]|nr:M23 family metallopeptidase [Bacilli bacterium]